MNSQDFEDVIDNLARIKQWIIDLTQVGGNTITKGECSWTQEYLDSAVDLLNNQAEEIKIKKREMENTKKLLETTKKCNEDLNREIKLIQNPKKTDNQRLQATQQPSTQKSTISLPQLFRQGPKKFDNHQGELEKLRINNAELQEKLKFQNSQISDLIATIASFQRDGTTSSTSDARPQHHLLVNDFRHLAEQDFQFISILIFTYGCQKKIFSQENRTHDIAVIKSILSRELFDIEEIVNKQKGDTLIQESICKRLQINTDNSSSSQIMNQLEKLIDKGIKLVHDIALAYPSGQLIIEEEGTRFNPERNKAELGCKEGGTISFTVYPGYLVGNRIFEKAIVFTQQ